MSKALDKRVRFAQLCLLPSPVSLELYSLCNFVRRQCLIARIYTPWLYYRALAVTWLYVARYASAWGYVTYQLHTEPKRGAWLLPVIAIGAVWATRSAPARDSAACRSHPIHRPRQDSRQVCSLIAGRRRCG